MTDSVNKNYDLSEIHAWVEKLHELENSAMICKIMSEEERNDRLQSVIDGSCFEKYLNNVLRQKELTLKKLADLEVVEENLRNIIAELKNKTQIS